MHKSSQDEYQKVYDKAVRLLSDRLHTRAELKRKLTLKKYSPEAIEQVLDRLNQLKVLNDEQFAEIFLDNLIRYKTFGYYGLKAKLLARGVAGEIAERLLSQALSLDEEVRIGMKLASKKSPDRQKLIQALQRKGFSSSAIHQILSNVSA